MTEILRLYRELSVHYREQTVLAGLPAWSPDTVEIDEPTIADSSTGVITKLFCRKQQYRVMVVTGDGLVYQVVACSDAGLARNPDQYNIEKFLGYNYDVLKTRVIELIGGKIETLKPTNQFTEEL